VTYADPVPADAAAPAPTPAEDDVARGLAMLSPRAAQAVAAASSSNSDEESAEGDDAEVDEEPNRGALLRFLGSVNT
jgi:hypothetical protein